MSITYAQDQRQSEHTSVSSPSPSDDPRAGQEQQPSWPANWANKYKYEEFAPYSPGERLLKDILRAILPLALFSTWEILCQDNQAYNNDAYLGVTKLALARKRTDRKVRMDLDDLQGRQLLTIRHEYKIFREADGTMRAKPVAIKDFERLYDLAYEYLQWTQNPDCYIPPEREYVDLIRENEPLMRKLMRFDVYRRLLCNKKPGRETQEREIHQWYRNYDGDVPPLPGQDGERVEDVQDVTENTTEPIWKESLKESLQESVKEPSIERIESIDDKDKLGGVSFDSASSSEEREGADAGYTKLTTPNETDAHEETPPTPTMAQTNVANPTKQLPPFLGKGRAAARQQADLDPDIAEFVKRAMNAPQTEGAGPIVRKKKAADTTPNPLIERFVRTMSVILRDENKEASVTRSLRAVERKRLSQMDIVACLIMAYVIARDTKEVKEKYRRPDGKHLRMQIFCTMFERFAYQRTQGKFDYDEDHLEQLVANDPELHDFFECCSSEEMQTQASSTNGKPLTTTPVVESPAPGAAAPRSADDMSQADAEALAREILQESEKFGVVDAVPQTQKNGTSVVVVTTRKRTIPVQTAQMWRDICHLVEREH